MFGMSYPVSAFREISEEETPPILNFCVSPVPLKVEQTQLDTGFGVSKLVAEVGKPL